MFSIRYSAEFGLRLSTTEAKPGPLNEMSAYAAWSQWDDPALTGTKLPAFASR